MDPNQSQICRLCFQSSADSVNIWQTFECSTIASILTKHFWFQPQKDDTMSEWLCQSCWSHTETFHNFYERVQHVHEQTKGRFVDVGSGAEVDVIKAEPEQNSSAVLDVDMNSIKYEETSETAQPIDSEIASSSLDDCNDNGDDASDTRLSSDDEDDDYLPSNTSDHEDHEDTNTKRKLRSKSSHTNRTAKIEKQDSQIREIFPMKCNICDDTDVPFETWQQVNKHYRRVHNTSGYLVCCGRKFATRYLILEHVLRHTNPKAHQCDQCGRVCSNKFALKSHIDAAHAPRDTRMYKCSLCPSSFVKAGVLRVHVLNQHSDSSKQFPCEECGKSYRSEIFLKSHERLMHQTKLDHVCEICARQCRTKGALKRHILNQHSTTPQPKIQCDICGAWLGQPSLKRHMQSMHDEAFTAAKCTICNKLVKNRFALPNHMRVVHGGRRHQCVQCEKAFKTATQLKEHVACHTGEPLYNCKYCDQKFKANANFFAHRRRKHFAEYMRDRDAETKRKAQKTASIELDDDKTEND